MAGWTWMDDNVAEGSGGWWQDYWTIPHCFTANLVCHWNERHSTFGSSATWHCFLWPYSSGIAHFPTFSSVLWNESWYVLVHTLHTLKKAHLWPWCTLWHNCSHLYCTKEIFLYETKIAKFDLSNQERPTFQTATNFFNLLLNPRFGPLCECCTQFLEHHGWIEVEVFFLGGWDRWLWQMKVSGNLRKESGNLWTAQFSICVQRTAPLVSFRSSSSPNSYLK